MVRSQNGILMSTPSTDSLENGLVGYTRLMCQSLRCTIEKTAKLQDLLFTFLALFFTLAKDIVDRCDLTFLLCPSINPQISVTANNRITDINATLGSSIVGLL